MDKSNNTDLGFKVVNFSHMQSSTPNEERLNKSPALGNVAAKEPGKKSAGFFSNLMIAG